MLNALIEVWSMLSIAEKIGIVIGILALIEIKTIIKSLIFLVSKVVKKSIILKRTFIKTIKYRWQIGLIERRKIEPPMDFFINKYREYNSELSKIYKMIDDGIIDAEEQLKHGEECTNVFFRIEGVKSKWY